MLVHVGVMQHHLLFRQLSLRPSVPPREHVPTVSILVKLDDEQNVCKLVSVHLLMIQ